MLRNLPEGARYTATMSAPGDADVERPPLDPELEAMLDRQTWTTDRRLMAQLINSVNTLIRVSGSWEKGKEPQFPVVGPANWQEEQQNAERPTQDHSVEATMQRLFGA